MNETCQLALPKRVVGAHLTAYNPCGAPAHYTVEIGQEYGEPTTIWLCAEHYDWYMACMSERP